MHEVFVAVEEHRWAGGFAGGLDGLPLAQQGFKVVDQQIFADALGLGADQQAGAGGLDQHTEGAQTVALVLAIDAARNIDALAVGLQH